ncbi:MAG TPA: DUF4190 domain-containing protein [Anaerolineales bacterium]
MNRNAVISFTAGALTIVSFCLGVAPIPFTDAICYSISLLLAMIALITGFASLLQIRQSRESGRVLAWIGISIGGLTVVAVLCIITLIVLFFPSLEHDLQQIWIQLRH